MTLIFGHRGFSGLYPENTMLAIRKAHEVGAEGIEFDVHLTKDGVPVVMHDENAIRTTGTDAFIKDLSYEEFKALDAGYVKGGRFGFQAPPSLREVLEYVKESGLRINIEIKSGVFEYAGIEQKVIDMLDEFELREKTLISSFNHFTIKRVKAIAPDIRVGLLEESWLINAGAYTESVGAEDFNPLFNFLNTDTLGELRKHNRGINAWTINSQEDMHKALDYKLDIAISNWPDKFLEIRKQVTSV